MYAFDLDGTLADTYIAVLRSYQAAGVEPPSDFFGKPWRNWLQDDAAHRLKNELYLADYVRLVKPMPMAELFKQVGGVVLTGASAVAADAVLRELGLRPDGLHAGLTPEQKAALLTDLAPEGIYFDDSQRAIEIMLPLKPRGWELCCIHR